MRCVKISPIVVAVIAAIGCGGAKPQEAAATVQQQEEKPIVLAEAPAAVVAAAPSATGAPAIKGTVKFEGTIPAAEKVKMDADPVCKQQHTTPVMSEEVVVNSDGTLKNVFVYVKEGAKGPFPVPAEPVILDQKGCWYSPHVFGIMVNQPFEITNSDASLHNVNAKPTVNQPFNIAQPTKGMKTTKKFTKPELSIHFKCNVHPWMKAVGHVVENTFYSVSGEDGTFAITGLVAGTYTIEAVHEKYGAQTQSVTVIDGQAASVDFIFKAQ